MAQATTAAPGRIASTHSERISPRRKAVDRGFWALCGLALLFVIAPVVWILEGVIAKAAPHWQWSVFTHATTGTGGGLLDAIVGTLAIMVGVGIIAGIVGLGGGIYLAEVARPSIITTILRSSSEILSGIPSIVFGYCGYLALVTGLHWEYGLLPGVIVVAMLVVPYVTKATELALGQVPLAYREGAEALGMNRIYILRKIILRAGLPGILTGVIIASAISIGETAPLLYTAGSSTQYPSITHLTNHAFSYLTYDVYTYLSEPIASLQYLAFDAALILVVLVLGLILTSRLLVKLTQKYSPNAALTGRGVNDKRWWQWTRPENPLPTAR